MSPLTSVPRRVRGALVVARGMRGQRRAPYIPEEELARLRDARVREIVRYAAETVPHYRDLFRREDIDPREIRSAVDLERLPLLEKATVQADPERFRSTSPGARRAVPFRTTGSTGMPLVVFHDRRSVLENICYGERERDIETAFCGKSLGYVTLELDHPSLTSRHVREVYREEAFLPVRPERRSLSVEEPLERVIAAIDELRPQVIVGLGKYIETLFRTVAARDLRVHLPKLVWYGGNAIPRESRAFIEGRFGVPVLSRYTSVEAFKIGFFCEERRGFHLHEDLCHVAIVDEYGNRLPPGRLGEVVISNLVNRGTVLLNYRLGDLAALAPERCSCGRTFRLLEEIEGRVSEIVHLPDGTFVPSVAVWGVMKEYAGVIRYQLVQHEPERFEMKLVMADRATFEHVGRLVASELRVAFRGASVEATCHETIEPGPRGKHQTVIALKPDDVPGAAR